ncbi:hypothetical protein SDC9_130094 [bioreactor metagenome]|uniref:Uncharacterized protein n=1 Tax=bioreactor metagenome TaxID=1076179 RepID=A0A645D1K7_9ZZZZ
MENSRNLAALIVVGRFPFNHGGQGNRLIQRHVDFLEPVIIFVFEFIIKIVEHFIDDRNRIIPYVKLIGIGEQISLKPVFPIGKIG